MTAGFELQEVMSGWWSPDTDPDAGNLAQYREAADAGEAAGRVLEVQLTLATDDVEALTSDLSTPMRATGTLVAGGLLEQPGQVDGVVELVVRGDDPVTPDTEHMRYHLPAGGYFLEGFKVLEEGGPTQLWGASTTLYCTLHEGSSTDGPIVGRGVIRISPTGFAKQVTTFKITNEESELRELALLLKFGTSFFGALWEDFGNIVHPSTKVRRRAAPRLHRPLDVPRRQLSTYTTPDGVQLRLTRYQGGDRGPVVLVHGMGANTRTYTVDTIQPNLVEYLVGNGFDVWLQEWRGSTELPTRKTQFDADQVAQLDHPAAEAAIRDITGKTDLHWVTHCVGSMTWMMSTLAGWTTPASLVMGQVGAHPIGPKLTKIKAGLRAPDLLRKIGIRYMTTDAYMDESRGARLFDQVLRLYPIPKDERCDSAVCRRLAFIYGNAIHHDAVDDETHAALHELFGMTNLRMMGHLGRCAREEKLVTVDGEDAYLPNVERLRMPVLWLSGKHNGVWVAESTERDYAWATSHLGPEGFERQVFDYNGHQDSFMGSQAHERAFPAVLAHLERAGC